MKLKQLGPYRIVKQIGKGGMGAVYKAISEDSGPNAGMKVAIKALSPQLAMAEGFRERFEAEIESLKKLKHDGIVRLYGYGEQDGVLFYSMELVEGPSLEEEINDGRRFDWHETLRIGIQVCRALKHAHDHGVVHRDIKPANLMLNAAAKIKIADFGIARLFGGTQLTTAGGVLGTADYMSPEQADGRAVTEKCDQYSLGGVMYALLAGRPPFRAKTMPEMLQLQRFAEPEPVRRYASDTPDQLDRLITQLLAKNPAERFPNVLVLSRHMEAMEKAMSRPVQSEQDTGDTTADFLVTPSHLTASIDEEATHALEAPVVLPHDPLQATVQPDLYDAPTLAQPSDYVAPPADSKSLLEKETNLAEPAPTKTTRFTTVDEDARRQREQSQGSRLAMAAQLGGLLAALGLLIWGGMQLMKPPTADELFQSINSAVEADGINDLPRETYDEIESFFARFPQDPRTKELRPLREQLEFQKYERRVRARARFGDAAGLKPIEQIYFDAIAVTEKDPARCLAMLLDLLALYDPNDRILSFERAGELTNEFQELGDPRLLVNARRRCEQLQKQLQEQSAAQMPALQAKLAQAKALLQSKPNRAQRMYQAIVRLYSNQPWARDAVEQSRQALDQLARERDENN